MSVALYLEPALDIEARQDFLALADQFSLDITETLFASGLFLRAGSDGLFLAKVGEKGQVSCDFTAPTLRYRGLRGAQELLKRATGPACLSVWDATGGLGRDAFIFAALGMKVRVFERHHVVAALLFHGLENAKKAAKNDAALKSIIQNMTLHAGSMLDLADDLTGERPDVIYLDPMYPARQKSAAVKKEMAYFHELIECHDTENDAQLLHFARTRANSRVVVKRPCHGEFLAQEKPAYQYRGKAVRFDVYVPHD